MTFEFRRHGQLPMPSTDEALRVLTSDDPELWNVGADMHTYYEAFDSRCECEALCTCDQEDR